MTYDDISTCCVCSKIIAQELTKRLQQSTVTGTSLADDRKSTTGSQQFKYFIGR